MAMYADTIVCNAFDGNANKYPNLLSLIDVNGQRIIKECKPQYVVILMSSPIPLW